MRLIPIHTIPACENRKNVLVLSFRPFTNLDIYSTKKVKEIVFEGL